MTTIGKKEFTCLICNETDQYPVLTSTTSRGGYLDLDMRPPELVRSTLHLWIQSCTSCGYCSPDVSKGPDSASETIKSDEYLKQQNDDTFPQLARNFLCWAIILEAAGKYVDAGWSALRAAWACDDVISKPGAEMSRMRAVQLFEQAQENGIMFAKGPGTEESILADLLRRGGEFKKAQLICDQGIENKPSELVISILRFQKFLSKNEDGKCYTVGDVEKWKASIEDVP